MPAHRSIVVRELERIAEIAKAIKGILKVVQITTLYKSKGLAGILNSRYNLFLSFELACKLLGYP